MLIPRQTRNYLKIPYEPISILRILFDPAYGLVPVIANPDVFFPASIRALRTEIQLFRGEAWYDKLIQDMLRDCPLFEQYWTKSQSEPHYQIAARPLTPLEINSLEAGRLQFRIMSEPFTQDRRFRVIYWMPADSTTMQMCVM